MEILHVSAECYPVAKAGGLADVVGALPVYLQKNGHIAKVVLPMHRTPFLYKNEWEVVHKGSFNMGTKLDFTIIKEKNNVLGFDLYCVDINGLLDREKIYGYSDDIDRFLAFQLSVTEWLSKWEHTPDVIHVHDHHAALIPFMLQNVYAYAHLKNIKTILTIHNAQYQGWMGWDKARLLPQWDTWKWGLLEWDNTVNSLACGVKCASRVTTVSPGYLKELFLKANGLEQLFRMEHAKCTGIINGIDYAVWNPQSDTFILDNYSIIDVVAGKDLNKKKVCNDFGLNDRYPLIVFIGRLVEDKGADLLVESIRAAFKKAGHKFCFIILGSGEMKIEKEIQGMNDEHVGYYDSRIEYNEKLSHQLYAGADFLLMPSRVEPCGLNQLYAMRYGTIPLVRKTGGLADTVIDFGEENGFGITFLHSTVNDIAESILRAVELYDNKEMFTLIRKKIMAVDNSWEESTEKYIEVYSN